jgi:methylated-DNA-[protein]-cysteine S-methyltransferase
MTSTMRYRLLETFTGPFLLTLGPADRLATSWVDGDETAAPPGARLDPHLLPDVARRLLEYFSGRPVRFDDLPLPDGTEFQRRCWAACREIGWGQRCTYGQLALRAGSSTGAARAAGQAMRRNPLPVIVPCHRVVGGDGSLHGFSGSLDPAGPPVRRKRSLLAMEAGCLAEGLKCPAGPARSRTTKGRS